MVEDRTGTWNHHLSRSYSQRRRSAKMATTVPMDAIAAAGFFSKEEDVHPHLASAGLRSPVLGCLA